MENAQNLDNFDSKKKYDEFPDYMDDNIGKISQKQGRRNNKVKTTSTLRRRTMFGEHACQLLERRIKKTNFWGNTAQLWVGSLVGLHVLQKLVWVLRPLKWETFTYNVSNHVINKIQIIPIEK